MRRSIFSCLLLLAGCGAQIPEAYEWSFAPQDNLLAHLAAEPTNPDNFLLSLNFSVIALQARARQQPEFARCDRTPLPGCDYVVRLVEKRGVHAECRQVSLLITDEPPGKRRVRQMTAEKIECPAEIR